MFRRPLPPEDRRPFSPTRAGKDRRRRQLGRHEGLVLFVVASLFVLGAAPGEVRANECAPASPGSAPRAYLVTSSPGSEAITIFGHSAILMSGGKFEQQQVVNWGTPLHDSVSPTAFLRGDLEYTVTVESKQRAIDEAKRAERTLVADRLDLTPMEMERLSDELLLVTSRTRNENVFFYHWSSGNCTTMIRDLLDRAMVGDLKRSTNGPSPKTYRSQVLRHFRSRFLYWFVWNFAANGSVDEPLSLWDSMFLPDTLAQILRVTQRKGGPSDGTSLVSSTCILHEAKSSWPDQIPPRRELPLAIAGGVVLLAGIVNKCGAGCTRKALLAYSSALTNLASVALGCLAALVGSISVSSCWVGNIDGLCWNENWLVANPASLAFALVGVARFMGWQWCVDLLRPFVFLLTFLALLPFMHKIHDHCIQENLGILCLFAASWLGISCSILQWRDGGKGGRCVDGRHTP